VVQVLDAQQNPIPNRAVTWIVTAGGGSVSAENTTTDAQGFASTRWTLGPAAGSNSLNAVVSGVGTATFTATGTAGTPSASNSEVTASPTSITAGGSSTVTVRVRDASNNPVAGVTVSIASSGTGNTIDPATASTGADGVATFTFSSTVAESKTISATAGGVAITDGATIDVQKAASTTRIISDENDPSSVGQTIRVEFTVGPGTAATGNVTITLSDGPETCSGTLTNGAGFCEVLLTVPGPGGNNRRIITATYSGDSRFQGSTDTENHRVNPLPTANNPPTAAFTPPSCAATQPCQFTDASTDSDGNVVSWSWTFGDTHTGNGQTPTNTYAASGNYTVTLTVTDDKGATNSVTHTVTAHAFANPDTYTTQATTTLTVGNADRTLVNDVGGVLIAAGFVNGSGPLHGTVRNWDVSGTFDYTPNNDGATLDTFSYEVSDEYGIGNVTTVTINITP
jgi:PKD repeat protein